MSVYKPNGRDYYVIEFQIAGRRFCISTKATTKRAAESLEIAERERAKQLIAAEKAVAAAFDGKAPLTLTQAAARYWEEAGQHHANAATTWIDLERALRFFGAERRIDEIRDGDIIRFVTKRRADTVKARLVMPDGSPAPKLRPSTVNRSTVDLMRKLLTHARVKWSITLPHEPSWKQHRLKEGGKPIREMKAGLEESRISSALGDGYRSLWRFAVASGLRLAECFLRWEQIDWETATIKVMQKGEREHMIPLSSEMRAILVPCVGHNPEWVFCYVAQRTRKVDDASVRCRGARAPVTYSGMKTEWRRKVKTDLDLNLRFHDMRHTRASRMLRSSGNLKIVQRLLGHADINTTSKFYANVEMDDVRAALERDNKSRQKSRRPKKNPPKPLMDK